MNYIGYKAFETFIKFVTHSDGIIANAEFFTNSHELEVCSIVSVEKNLFFVIFL